MCSNLTHKWRLLRCGAVQLCLSRIQASEYFGARPGTGLPTGGRYQDSSSNGQGFCGPAGTTKQWARILISVSAISRASCARVNPYHVRERPSEWLLRLNAQLRCVVRIRTAYSDGEIGHNPDAIAHGKGSGCWRYYEVDLIRSGSDIAEELRFTCQPITRDSRRRSCVRPVIKVKPHIGDRREKLCRIDWAVRFRWLTGCDTKAVGP
jgi:hypothetical protein